MSVKPDTIARTVILALAIINQLLTMAGINPIPVSEGDIYQVCTLIATIGASIWAWWMNNSFTKAAIKADEIMDEIKADS